MKAKNATQSLPVAGLLLVAVTGLIRASAAEMPVTPFSVDYKSLVAHADLTYTKPVDRSEEGLPVGNGRMGSLVWTTPDALKFQLNRVDVFAAGCETHAFPRAGSDYGGGCGMVDVRLVDFGDDVFAATNFRQHLSVYAGVMTARGNGLTAHVMAWQEGDALGVDAELRPLWKEFYENMRPLPDGPEPAEYYDLITIASADAPALQRLRDTFARQPVNEDSRLRVLSRQAVAAANLGLASHVKYLIPGQIKTSKENCDPPGVGESRLGVMRNRLGMREGPGCLECQRLGNAANALHAALLQTAASAPGNDSVIRVFAAWPPEWDAEFLLAARGAFLVGSSMQNGKIGFVHIQSQAGGACRLMNPWPGKPAVVHEVGKAETIPLQLEERDGECLVFATVAGHQYRVAQK